MTRTKTLLVVGLMGALGAVQTKAGGEDYQVCTDLAKATSSRGLYTDGTGWASATDYENQFRGYRSSNAPRLIGSLQAALKNPNNRILQAAFFGMTSTNAESTSAESNNAYRAVVDLIWSNLGLEFSDVANVIKVLHLKEMNGNLYFSDQKVVANFKAFMGNYLVDQIQANESKMIMAAFPFVARVQDRIENRIFPAVRKLLLEQIRAKAPKQAADLMMAKVEQIGLEKTGCAKMAPDSAPAIAVQNAFYNPTRNSFNYCSGLVFRNTSEFQIAFVIAHELSHSIDPQGIQFGPSDFALTYTGPKAGEKKSNEEIIAFVQNQYPLPKTLACLRSKESVGASLHPIMGWRQGAFSYDQITETFADWMGAETLAAYAATELARLTPQQKRMGFANAMRGFSFEPRSGWEVHPNWDVRANRILMVNPEVRKQMGCVNPIPAPAVYCDAG